MDREIANCVVVSKTQFALVYGTEVVLPMEVGLPSYCKRGFDEEENNLRMREELNFTDELRDKALFKMVQYKHLMARTYKRQVKNRQFKVGDLLLRMYANKLSPKWEGPYKIAKVVGPETYELSHLNGKSINHTWHATILMFEFYLKCYLCRYYERKRAP
ncbi:hypothetical protein LIER_43998 [Lithospermum erythrorhizon]|uniref:Uncharacterized protein n=1 Tax=Lithospermum erythrorhizon TaxID=34254 RepID=A0AAV3RJM1_LITER